MFSSSFIPRTSEPKSHCYNKNIGRKSQTWPALTSIQQILRRSIQNGHKVMVAALDSTNMDFIPQLLKQSFSQQEGSNTICCMICFNLLVLHDMFVLQELFSGFGFVKSSSLERSQFSYFLKCSFMIKQETCMNILDRDQQ